MTLRYMPADAGPIIKQAQNKAAELETQFNRMFSSVGYLDQDANKVLYRPLFFSKDFRQQDLVWSVYSQCSFGKTHRSFGDFYNLYLTQMNGLNFARALTGPGVHYKDGKLARTYIHRILDTSNEMLAELVQLQGKAQKLKADLSKLPSTFDAEWEKRYQHMKVLVDNLLHDMARCVTLVTERGDLGEQILAIWFPEEVEEDELPPPVARSSHSPAFARASVPEPVVASAADDPVEVRSMGTKLDPHVLALGSHDVRDVLRTSFRGQATFFKVAVSEGGAGKHYRVELTTDPSMDWDTHIRARQNDRVIFAKQETSDTTPHNIAIVPTTKTDNIEIEIQYWERGRQPNAAYLEVKLEEWDDGGV